MIGSFEPTQKASSDSIICVRGHPVVRPFVVHAFWKRQNETRNRSLTFKNAFPPRETDQNFLKTPSRGGKWGKFSEKRLPAAGNGKKSQKNGFPRREMGKILRKTPSCGGKAVKFAGDRFPATGNGAFLPKNAFRRGNGVFYRAMFMSQKRTVHDAQHPAAGRKCRSMSPSPLILPHPCSI